MELRDVRNTRASWLAQMMDLDDVDQVPWKPDELEAILKHQLSASLQSDFSYLEDQPPQPSDTLGSAEDPPMESFNDLLHHPRPPVALLERAKEFARTCRKRPDCLLPEEIAALLYILSIVVARTRCQCRITKLDDHALRDAVDWALEQSWVDEPTRELLRESYQVIGCAEPKSDV
jgi:hypothetical protein